MNKEILEELGKKIYRDLAEYKASLAQLPAAQIVADAENIAMVQHVVSVIQTAIEQELDGVGGEFSVKELQISEDWLKIENIAKAIVNVIYETDIFFELPNSDISYLCGELAEDSKKSKQQNRIE